MAGDSRPTHGVSGEALERGIASLEAYAAYLAGIPGHPPPRLLLTSITAMQGRRMGVSNAVLFRAHDFHAPPPIALESLEAMQEDGAPDPCHPSLQAHGRAA